MHLTVDNTKVLIHRRLKDCGIVVETEHKDLAGHSPSTITIISCQLQKTMDSMRYRLVTRRQTHAAIAKLH